ncbi:MAG: type VI secretion system tip protein TssI/VgrG [Byssovorax sp.]
MPKDRVEVRLESTDFACEHVHIARMNGDEAISRLFAFDLEIVVVTPGELTLDELSGSEADLVFSLGGAELRRVHGMVSGVEDLLDSEPSFRTFRLRLSPRAFRLTLVETQEIFLDLSVPDIIKAKLALVGLGDDDVQMRLMSTYPAREFVVQYKETDLAFISRLTEHLGISFFFEQHEGRDLLVFTDHAHGFSPIVRDAPVLFRPRGEQCDVFGLVSKRQIMPAAFVQQDYNYRTPLLDLTTTHEVPEGFAGGVVEYCQHPKTPEASQSLARVRAEERFAETRYLEGKGDVCAFSAGATFHLDDHPRFDGGKDFLLVSLTHTATQVVVGFSMSPDVTSYVNEFRLTEASRTYRPARATKRPRIDGVLTGVIEPSPEGVMGKMAQLDDQGRYTVRFYFDPAPLGGRPHNTHRVRMIQQHSGPNYGTHMPLKAGTEVLVVFVDGDPDRPLIVGSVHNPATPTPVTSRNPSMHRIVTASGIMIEMKDHF